MRQKRKLLIPIFMITAVLLHSQEWDSYRWKNRLVVVEDKYRDSKPVTEQLRLLSAEQEAFEERKTLIIRVWDSKFQVMDGDLQERNSNYPGPNRFLIKLIGLDGGVKFSSDEVVKPGVLTDLIDSMPMRKAEMKRKGNR